MIQTFVISYDEAPKSLNAGGTGSRRHWAAGHREKKKWEGIYAMLLLARKVPRGMTHCTVDVLLEFRHNNRRDVENYRSSVSKPLADCLVAGGWMRDDTAKEFTLRDVEIQAGALHHPSPLVKSRVTVKIEADYDSDSLSDSSLSVSQ